MVCIDNQWKIDSDSIFLPGVDRKALTKYLQSTETAIAQTCDELKQHRIPLEEIGFALYDKTSKAREQQQTN
jgi:hypothetical protein